MKKLFFVLVLLCYVSTKVSAQHVINELTFIVEHVNTGGTNNPLPKSPELPPDAPEATLEDNVLTFTSAHDDYTLTLLDEDGETAYQTSVPSSVSIVVLPATLSGDFELQLDYGGDYYFYCDIEL